VSEKEISFKKRLLMSVHLSQRYVHYYKEDREAYEKLLLEHFEVSSSRDCSIKQLIALVDYLNFKSQDLAVIIEPKNRLTKKQIALMRALWIGYAKDNSDKALLNFIFKIAKNRYLSLEVVSKEDSSKVISILKKAVK